MFKVFQRHIPREDNSIHGEGFRPEVGIKEVDGKDKSNRQQRFVTVNDLGNIDKPTREEAGKENREPEHQATESDYSNPPEDGYVVKLLPIGPSSIIGPGAPAKEPLNGGNKIPYILHVEPEGIFPKDEFYHGESFPSLLLQELMIHPYFLILNQIFLA